MQLFRYVEGQFKSSVYRKVPPTLASVYINEELPLRELLEVLLGPEGRRRLQLRHMTNEDLFSAKRLTLGLHYPSGCVIHTS